MSTDESGEMFTILLESALICAVTWTLWNYFRQMCVKSPLDNIPGPPSPSWMSGKSTTPNIVPRAFETYRMRPNFGLTMTDMAHLPQAICPKCSTGKACHSIAI